MDILSELAQWRASGTLMELGGHRIFVREAGQGPPLLCLHGFPTASFDYVRLLPLLSHYRLITLDFLGFGFSDKPRPYTYSLFEQAMLAEEVAARRGVTEAALLAHDMGSSVALIILQRARLRISRFVLLNGSILLEHYQPLITQRLLLHPRIGPLDEAASVAARDPAVPDRVEWARIVPFIGMHLVCFTVIWVGWSPVAVLVAVSLSVSPTLVSLPVPVPGGDAPSHARIAAGALPDLGDDVRVEEELHSP